MSDPRHLDDAVRASLRSLDERGVPRPRALFLLATGTGTLPERLQDGVDVPLGELPESPAGWDEAVLHAGRLGDLDVWLVADHAGEPEQSQPGQAGGWHAAFPVWLAAAAGARLCVHTSAGSALFNEEEEGLLQPGDFGLARDHVNLSGENPLVGLGPPAPDGATPPTETPLNGKKP